MAGDLQDLSDVLRAALDHVEEPVIVTRPGEPERIIYVNAAFERVSGYRRDAAVGRTLADLVAPRPVEGEPGIFVATRADRGEYFVRRERRDGDFCAGALLVEVQRDVTAERREAAAMRALRESEELYRNLTERSADLISRTDATGGCIYLSPSVRNILGYEPEELVGRTTLVDLAHPDNRPARLQTLERFVEKGKTSGSPVRMRVRRKDGVYVWLETLTHVVRDAEGRILEVQSWARDVTARVLTEQALTEWQANFRTLLDRLPEGIVVHREGIVRYANPRFLRMIGRDPSENLVGTSIIELVHPDDREWLSGRIAAQDRPSTRSLRHRLLRRDASPLLIEVTALPMMFEGRVAFVAICYDVTEKTLMEERLASAERMAFIGRLASGVGHEINNPLTYMMNSLELARAELSAIARQGPPSERHGLDGHGLAFGGCALRAQRSLVQPETPLRESRRGGVFNAGSSPEPREGACCAPRRVHA